jgi:hypothetical protein
MENEIDRMLLEDSAFDKNDIYKLLIFVNKEGLKIY